MSRLIDADVLIEMIKKHGENVKCSEPSLDGMKKLKEYTITAIGILYVILLIILLLCMSFIPYEPTTYEDIQRMELRERIRMEQRIW